MKRIKNSNMALTLNGQPQPIQPMVQNAMFYPNTYLNFDAFGNYTKHYYNGTERIASRLGDNNTTIAIDNMLENRKLSLEERVRNEIQELISEPTQVDMPPMLDILNLQPTGTPNDIFYYHPNHLGSTSFVTDQNQTITQGFLYAPFGEITTEYNINFGNNTIPKYSFNAKELDEETGMYYYEARYYKPPVFTSRDAMFEKYFWMSPYAYCANNPVKYVDPTGCEKVISLVMNSENTTKNRKNQRLYNAADRYMENEPVIHLWAHGDQNKIEYCNSKGKPDYIKDGSDMNDFLTEQSTIYKENQAKGQTSILVLHSCETGKGEDNIAKQLSNDLNLLVVAPSEKIVTSRENKDTPQEFCYEIGVNKVIEKANGKNIIGKRGAWNIYYKGVKVDSFNGHTKPIFRNPQKTIEKYEQIYQKINGSQQE